MRLPRGWCGGAARAARAGRRGGLGSGGLPQQAYAVACDRAAARRPLGRRKGNTPWRRMACTRCLRPPTHLQHAAAEGHVVRQRLRLVAAAAAARRKRRRKAATTTTGAAAGAADGRRRRAVDSGGRLHDDARRGGRRGLRSQHFLQRSRLLRPLAQRIRLRTPPPRQGKVCGARVGW